MGKTWIRAAKKSDAKEFIALLVALAKFERLEPPSKEAQSRILHDVFTRRRVKLVVASDGEKLVGYALYYYTYSSFLAKPTLYLEDLFVLEEHRSEGVGYALFRSCVDRAVKEGCGRMEWAVLTWNEKAMKFYEKQGAKKLADWFCYRLEGDALLRVLPARVS